jgi:hypothetical protein
MKRSHSFFLWNSAGKTRATEIAKQSTVKDSPPDVQQRPEVRDDAGWTSTSG